MEIPSFTEFYVVLWNCVIAWFYIYGIWLYSSELVLSTLSFTLFGTFGLFLLIHFQRIPPPPSAVVLELLGRDPYDVEEAKLTDSDGYFMKTCAHRFAGLDAPENSIAALRKCIDKGCNFFEFDVALSKDGIPVLFHDSDINRLCNESGTVKDMPWTELSELDISVKHPLRERFLGEHIARFDETLQLCLEHKCRMFIDLKGDDMKLVPYVLDAFKQNPQLYTRAVVSSFNPALVYMIRRADPAIVGSLAWRPYFYSHEVYTGQGGPERARYSNPLKHYVARFMDILHGCMLDKLVYYLLGISTILLHKDVITMDVAHAWRQKGVRLIAFTANLPLEKQFFRRILRVPYMTDTLDLEGC